MLMLLLSVMHNMPCLYVFDHVIVTHMLYDLADMLCMPWFNVLNHVYVIQINIYDAMMIKFLISLYVCCFFRIKMI